MLYMLNMFLFHLKRWDTYYDTILLTKLNDTFNINIKIANLVLCTNYNLLKHDTPNVFKV